MAASFSPALGHKRIAITTRNFARITLIIGSIAVRFFFDFTRKYSRKMIIKASSSRPLGARRKMQIRSLIYALHLKR